MKPAGYADLADRPEDERIAIIGKYVTVHRMTVGVALDNDEAKIERYIAKLLERFPDVEIVSRTPLLAHTVLVRVGPKKPVTS
jgi:hypothetical protein